MRERGRQGGGTGGEEGRVREGGGRNRRGGRKRGRQGGNRRGGRKRGREGGGTGGEEGRVRERGKGPWDTHTNTGPCVPIHIPILYYTLFTYTLLNLGIYRKHHNTHFLNFCHNRL